MHGEAADARTTAIRWLRARRAEMAGVPLPASGDTLRRWQWLAAVARRDLSAARLAEGHLDAIAILTELGRAELVGDGCWGVWAAQPAALRAIPTAIGEWRLEGEKSWCSGSTALDRALVVATAPDGPRLFVVNPAALEAVVGSWNPLGMEATASETLSFDIAVDAEAAIGGSDSYVDRLGFWYGAMGVAACWYGGAIGVADGLLERARSGHADVPSVWAATGRVRSRLDAGADRLRIAARAVDAHDATIDSGRRLALSLRLTVEETARAVLDDVNVACGAGALAHDRVHAGRVADLTLYIRQLHRDRDECALGEMTSGFAW